MKICLISDQLVGHHKSWSGAELVCKQVVEFLKKEKQEVIFITTEFDKKNNSREILQIPIVNVKSNILKIFVTLFFRILGIVYSFKYLKREKPDIVHFLHSNYLSIPVMISTYILKIPTVFTVLDYFIICPRNNLRLDDGKICSKKEGLHCLKCVSWLKFLEKIIIRIFSKNLKKVITFTETSRARLIKHGIPAEKIRVIYTYNPPQRSEKTERIAPNSILFVGTFFEYKGLHILLQAMPEIISEVPESKLMIVGMGNEREWGRIERMLNDLKIRDHVIFLGQKKNEEVFEAVLKSEVVVVTEQWPSDFGPLIVVEAMALGKPVVASKIGAIPEFIKDGKNGFLAPHNQPAKFAEKIINIFKDKQAAQLIGEQAKKDINSFLAEDREKKVLELYKDMIK